MDNKNVLEKATLAAGCFWGVQDAFDKIRGVKETVVGYTGGHTENPTYEDVCSDRSGHAEAVEIIFDPKEISYAELLDEFWRIHNPTTPNRQGADEGSQYRSAIFYHSPEQKKIALASKAALEISGKYHSSVVTEIVPASSFYKAEEYHQKYVKKTGRGDCHIVE